MKTVSYGPQGHERAGLLMGERIYDLERLMLKTGKGVAVSDMRLFLEQANWRSLLDDLALATRDMESLDLQSVRLGAPVPLPRKLLIAGANTHSHLAEAKPLLGKIEPPRQPMVLGKGTNSICGPRDSLILPKQTRKLDYEVELGVIIGKVTDHIQEKDVRHHIAGFTTTNDVSARDVQLAEYEANSFFRVHYLGKSFNTFAPMGPAMVTVDEYEWGRPFGLVTKVNGEVRQSSDTTDLIYGIEALVAYISQHMTLYPGDVIQTGSPAGVAFFMNPQRFLQPGDVVSCEIDGVGTIANQVVAEV
jgi:2-keto-4-pentenoate hydratase/2-oxohepta-3-ene-1,7-dioic acid hydratase in catechol pathway